MGSSNKNLNMPKKINPMQMNMQKQYSKTKKSTQSKKSHNKTTMK